MASHAAHGPPRGRHRRVLDDDPCRREHQPSAAPTGRSDIGERPVRSLRPLAPAIALNACYGTPTPVEATALRRVAALDALLALAVVAATAAVATPVAAGWIGGVNDFLADSAVRNLACYTGLALIGRTALGNHVSTVIPTLLALTVSVFGYGPEQAAHWWAWPAAQPSDVLSWAGSAALLMIGLYRTAQGDFPRRS
ncbi:hypothetical protein [Streptomyces sp. SID2888]|uniref:hypothetical protein n=1 Tax=Streptomyces sp. SID2888 TaxID=2690256 RepID=UPI00136F3E90|nr:hypothetical protein [Streptomyces sp. SID2888]MYV49385.1 hypothetical protein [Streptomyces sp. SID2888]